MLPSNATVEIPEEGQIFDFNDEYNDEDDEVDFFEDNHFQYEEDLLEENQNEGLFGNL